MSRFADQIRQLVELLDGGNAAAFARRLGMSAQNFHSWLTGPKSVPGGEKLRLIVEKTSCSAHWLLTGKGEPFPPSVIREGEESYLPVLATASAAESTRVAETEHQYRRKEHLPAGIHLIKITGDSMIPLALDGQHILCSEEEPKDGDLAVVELDDGELLFKRVFWQDDKLQLISVNPDPRFKPVRLRRSQWKKLRKVWGVKF